MRGRDLGSAEAAMRAVSEHITLPDGYRIDWLANTRVSDDRSGG